MELQDCLETERFSEIAKRLDKEIENETEKSGETTRLQQLYCNRGWCYQRLNLNRKALKDYTAAIKLGVQCPKAHLHRGRVLWALNKKEEAMHVWKSAVAASTMDDDMESVFALVACIRDAERPQTLPEKKPAPPIVQSSSAISKSRDPPEEETPADDDIIVSQKVKKMLEGLQPEAAVGLAVEKINQGQLAEAEEMLEELAKTSPDNPGVRIARGTARALLRKLESAIDDFSAAIKVYPMYSESWKRRGQARGALGQNDEAIADLEKALQISTDPQSKAECLTEQGTLYHKMKDYRKAVGVLERSLELYGGSAQAANMLGLCSISLGDIQEGLEAYERAIQINRHFKDAYFNKCQALKEVGRVKDAEVAYKDARRMEKEIPVGKHLGINRVMASMYQGMGQHHRAIPFLDEALESTAFKQKLECYFLRGACYHAMGRHSEAEADYLRCIKLERTIDKDDGEERRQFTVLAFYQKEMALYLRHQIDVPIDQFCMDVELPPVFKELWCKKGGATRELIMKYSFQRPIEEIPRPPRPPEQHVTAILRWADHLGKLLQNKHQGFLPNSRQQRSAGCAALELAQAILTDLEFRKNGRSGWFIPTKGSSGWKGADGQHRFHWRDAMDVLVKWRQLSEPNDQVVWVDLLTPEEFSAGFGSHTPMFSGQTKCVRYYMNFARALDKQKEVLLETGKAYNSKNEAILIQTPEKRQQVREAQTASDIQDSWVIVPITSLTNPEQMMEGTRLTLVKVPDQWDGFEFSIRTPVTPPRWRQFEADLSQSWEQYMLSLQSGDPVEIAKCILAYAYYWYNFMPLARGTAACGYTTILSLFWAAGMAVTVGIPTDYQVDWEAILVAHPDTFIRAMYKWLVPVEARPEEYKHQTLPVGSVDCGVKFPPPMTIPLVREVLDTTRKRLEALNGLDAERI